VKNNSKDLVLNPMYALTTDELLDFASGENHRWHEWFKQNPATLDLPIDIAQAKTVREVVLHILIVELRYSERLLDKKVTEYNEIPTDDIDRLFATSAQSKANFRRFLAQTSEYDWRQVLTFPTRTAGTLSASKRKIYVHALLHGMRHWAQLATLLRQQGYKQNWAHDFIATNVMD
jgi:uncharacterized damage-inducible protein DinB